MGLRCLLGHDFGEPETEREREEKGEEMVVTFRTVKTCSRCGETQVVSENKEVTSIPEVIAGEETGTDDATDEAADDTAERTVTTDGTVTTDAVTAADDDAELIDADADADIEAEADVEADGTVDDAVATADPVDDEPTHPRVDDEPEEFNPPQSAEEDDGVILDDDADEEPADRQPGEWPDSSDVGRGDDDRMPTLEEVEGSPEASADEAEAEPEPKAEHSPWPDQRGEDEGFAAEVGGNDEDVDVDFGNKLAPELDEAEKGYDAEFIGNAADSADAAKNGGPSGSGEGGITSAETLTREEASELPTEYYCPECEMTRPADHSSMRAGDICPECHHGYITERER